jgi:hypothetical protein
MDKTYVFNSDGGANGFANSVLPLLQQRGIDPAILLNGNNCGFGGGWNDIIALIVVAALFGNGNFGFGGGNNNQNSAEREMLMSAIQRNGTDISQLAQSIGCSTGRLQDAIGQVSTQICNLAGQQGMSFQQVINSIQMGNSQLSSQLASCCCDIRQAINGVNVGLERGFSSVAYETQRQTCDIEKAIANSTEAILAGQRNAEMREMQNKIDSLREKNSQQAVILNNAQQTAQFSAMLAPIAQDLEKIKCRLPETITIPTPNDYVRVNREINAPYCGFGFGTGFNFGGWNGGYCGNNSLWG